MTASRTSAVFANYPGFHPLLGHFFCGNFASFGAAAAAVVNVVNHHGLPRSLISDRNQITLSEFWKHVCAMLDYQSVRLPVLLHHFVLPSVQWPS